MGSLNKIWGVVALRSLMRWNLTLAWTRVES